MSNISSTSNVAGANLGNTVISSQRQNSSTDATDAQPAAPTTNLPTDKVTLSSRALRSQAAPSPAPAGAKTRAAILGGQSAPSSKPKVFDPADTNHDGIVTSLEKAVYFEKLKAAADARSGSSKKS